ncbi:MAG TPA: hypothetical protein VHT52_10490 [Stellaceae bacterium]|nr:hypothetical protein [Stellaceae bacterium]
MCCKLLPVGSVGKLAGEKCKHQKFGKGCAVYAKLWGVSPECKLWSCGWLTNAEEMAGLSRPDRSHYVIDPMPEFITVTDRGEPKPIGVVQVWCDPDYPDAHRDPALRAWLEKRNMPALVRYDNKHGLVIFPPSYMDNHEWLEKHSNLNAEAPHTFEQVMDALSGT